MLIENAKWVVCQECLGRGTKSKKLSKKLKHAYEKELKHYEESNCTIEKPLKPKAHQINCVTCDGTGILPMVKGPTADETRFPHVAIIGAGIAGLALAIACKHRGIPFSLYERDKDCNVRKQGYGLTLQQAGRVMKCLGIQELKDRVISTRHIAFNEKGEILGEWGTRKWCAENVNKEPKRSNIHIARQLLRQELINQLPKDTVINWGYQLIDYKIKSDGRIHLNFQVDGMLVSQEADLLVAADGIRSIVRRILLGDSIKPLRYLNIMVILGICELKDIHTKDFSLLDAATIFQTANARERLYVMPYKKDSVMWQLSFSLEEKEAKELSLAGSIRLKEEAIRLTNWHEPIPQLIAATDCSYISGYPVYDRDLLSDELEVQNMPVTLIGDAAHPMSPFKGQGANQAILDALQLAKSIYLKYHYTSWNSSDIRKDVLHEFEKEMLSRTAVKVKDSAAAVEYLHSELVFEGGDQPRGSCQKKG